MYKIIHSVMEDHTTQKVKTLTASRAQMTQRKPPKARTTFQLMFRAQTSICVVAQSNMFMHTQQYMSSAQTEKKHLSYWAHNRVNGYLRTWNDFFNHTGEDITTRLTHGNSWDAIHIIRLTPVSQLHDINLHIL
jgi:ribosomal protein S18 acetylase RimI-like enzyme